MSNSNFDVSRRAAATVIASGIVATTSGGSALSAPNSFLVFFDWGQSDFSASGAQIVEAISRAIKPNGKVSISGHCDTSEPKPDELALARAKSILVGLVKNGSTFVITVESKGARVPMQPTKPDVREPRNRRVEVVVN